MGLSASWALQWAWPVPLIAVLMFAPESPWWLVRQGRIQDAEHSVRRLAATADLSRVSETVAMMVRTNQLEIDTTAGATYRDCFRRTDLRRTEILCCAFACQVTWGMYFGLQSTYFFTQAGLAPQAAYDMFLGILALACAGNVGAWLLIRSFARRTLYLRGLGAMTLMMFLIGILAVVPGGNNSLMWAQGACMFVWIFFYTISVGPPAFAILAETSSTRLRGKTVGLARNTYTVLAIVATILFPYMLNPSAWNWAGKTGLFWGPVSLLSFIWTYFRVPETKGRSYMELDVLFERKISACKFASTVIEPEAEEHQMKATTQ